MLLKILKVATWKIDIYGKVVENVRIKFFVSPYRILLICRKEYLKYLLNYLWQLPLAMALLPALWICEEISIEILPIPQWTFTYFLKRSYKNTQTRRKVCSNLSSVLKQFFLFLLVTFINFEHLSRSTLPLLFKQWKVK